MLTSDEFQQDNGENLEVWWSKQFQQVADAEKYAKVFVQNDVDRSLVSQLNHEMLVSMGIDKAGQRQRIISLKKDSEKTPLLKRSILETNESAACYKHRERMGVDKCVKCAKYQLIMEERNLHTCYSEIPLTHARFMCVDCKILDYKGFICRQCWEEKVMEGDCLCTIL